MYLLASKTILRYGEAGWFLHSTVASVSCLRKHVNANISAHNIYTQLAFHLFGLHESSHPSCQQTREAINLKHDCEYYKHIARIHPSHI